MCFVQLQDRQEALSVLSELSPPSSELFHVPFAISYATISEHRIVNSLFRFLFDDETLAVRVHRY